MLEIKNVELQKKPILKSKNFWIGSIIALIVIFSFINRNSVPNDIEKNFYGEALDVFHELNTAYESQEMPDESVTSWIAKYTRSMESYPSDYTEKEKVILISLRSMVVNVGMIQSYGSGNGLEEEINTARSNLSAVLEVSEDY